MNPTNAKDAETMVPAKVGTTHGRDRRDPCLSRNPGGLSRRSPYRSASTDQRARAMSLEVAARDYVWLYDFRHGMGPREIAAREGVNVRQVREALERARALESSRSRETPTESARPGRPEDLGFRLIPLFPIGAFTPQSACPHGEPIERGSTFCCMVCHASGMDDHPGLRRDPLTDPSPETDPTADGTAPRRPVESKQTRKQQRRRKFIEAAVA